MFDRKEAIERWRAELELSGVQADDIDELQSHLEDAMEELQAGDMSEQEAFQEARRALGQADDLGKEFRKLRSLLLADYLMLGVLGILVAGLVVLLWYLPTQQKLIMMDPLLLVHVSTLTTSYVLAGIFALAGCYSVLRRCFTKRVEEVWFEKLRLLLRWTTPGGLVLVLTGLVTGCFWAHQAWGAYWMGNLREWGAVAVTAWYVLATVRLLCKKESNHVLPALTVAGGLVVLFSWFGAGGFADRAGFTIVAMLLIAAFIGAQRLFREEQKALA